MKQKSYLKDQLLWILYIACYVVLGIIGATLPIIMYIACKDWMPAALIAFLVIYMWLEMLNAYLHARKKAKEKERKNEE
jgi:predicted tellurium resistance membrane protein TerC